MKPSEYIAKGWCQGAGARDASGCVVQPYDPTATVWCLYGAIMAAYPDDIVYRGLIHGKLDPIIQSSISHYNDDPKRTQAEVVALLQYIGE